MDIRRVKHFNTEAEFLANRCVLPIPSVAYCKATGELYFRKKTKLLPGHIVLWDDDESKRIYVLPSEYNGTTYPTSRYIPEGIIAIPEQFTPDGRAVMISLVNMSCETPETAKQAMMHRMMTTQVFMTSTCVGVATAMRMTIGYMKISKS